MLTHAGVRVVKVVNGRSVQAQRGDDVHEFVHGGVEQLIFDAKVVGHALT